MEIQTLIFFDLETSGLPCHHEPKITELSMHAISRHNFEQFAMNLTRLEARGQLPRVVERLCIPMYPGRLISLESSEITGLDNYNLQFQKTFDTDTFLLLFHFIQRQRFPVCLIAHNGDSFDFPILKQTLVRLGKALPDDVFCADSLKVFRKLVPYYDLLMGVSLGEPESTFLGLEELPTASAPNPFQLENERTPEKQIIRTTAREKWAVSSEDSRVGIHIRRRLAYEQVTLKPRQSYRLSELYKKFYGQMPPVSHTADDDVRTLMQVTFAMPHDFLDIIDETATAFNTVKKL